MSEEQQLALALQMSMQGAGMEAMTGLLEQGMETDGEGGEAVRIKVAHHRNSARGLYMLCAAYCYNQM